MKALDFAIIALFLFIALLAPWPAMYVYIVMFVVLAISRVRRGERL